MTEKKKRERVIAEISVAHLMKLARELGTPMTYEEAISFLNRDGRAYAMWKHMMQAGEDYLRTTLERAERTPLQMPAHGSRRPRMAV